MTDIDDRVLVRAVVAQGDAGALGLLYDRHTPYLYRFALRLTGGNEQVAQDVVHDAWVSAAERVATFEWRSTLQTWLAGIVVNHARRQARSDARLTSLDEPAGVHTDAALSGTYDRVDLERAIAALPDRARHVFVLHDVEGWTHEAIAEQLGIEPGTSKSQLSRARVALRARLESPEGDVR